MYGDTHLNLVLIKGFPLLLSVSSLRTSHHLFSYFTTEKRKTRKNVSFSWTWNGEFEEGRPFNMSVIPFGCHANFGIPFSLDNDFPTCWSKIQNRYFVFILKCFPATSLPQFQCCKSITSVVWPTLTFGETGAVQTLLPFSCPDSY